MAFLSPVYRVRAVPIEKIEPNTYNPNSVAPPELQLLYDSIREDGYTMPILSLIHISEPTRRVVISYAVFCLKKFFLMIRRPPRSTRVRSSAASDVYKRQQYSRLSARLPDESGWEQWVPVWRLNPGKKVFPCLLYTSPSPRDA